MSDLHLEPQIVADEESYEIKAVREYVAGGPPGFVGAISPSAFTGCRASCVAHNLSVYRASAAHSNPAQHPSIIHTRLAVALREIRLEPRHLLVRQPVQVDQIQSPHGA
jgi:hypothetical protein